MLVVLVFNDREVQNRIIQLERYYSPDELRRAANFLNEQLPRPHAARRCAQEILRQLQEAHEHMNQIMMDAISVAQHVFEAGDERGAPGIRDRGRDQSDGRRRALERRASCGACSRRSTRSATSCTCSTTACGPKACRSSSATNRATRCSMTAAWSPRPTRGRLGGGRARRHRPDPHGLRAGHPDRRHDGETARRRLEFAPLSPNSGDYRSLIRRALERSSARMSGRKSLFEGDFS